MNNILHNQKIKVLWTVLSGLFTICLIAIMFEYNHVRKQSQKLAELQDQYHTYIATLKMILQQQYDRYDMVDSCCDFVPLNRGTDYLWNATEQFFKMHQMGTVLSLFDQKDIQDYTDYWRSTEFHEKKSVSGKIKETKKKKPGNSSQLRGKLGAYQIPLLSWPIEQGSFWLSSPFGPRRKRDGSRGFHYGIDMAAMRGTPVKAASPGTVIEARHHVGYGNVIVIEHAKNFKTRYAHLDKILVSKGMRVVPTTVIGKVGETGYIRKRTKDGSHLHFELYDNGKAVNPLSFLPPLSLW